MEKPERKRHLGKPRYRLEDNIKMELREVGCDTASTFHLKMSLYNTCGRDEVRKINAKNLK